MGDASETQLCRDFWGEWGMKGRRECCRVALGLSQGWNGPLISYSTGWTLPSVPLLECLNAN